MLIELFGQNFGCFRDEFRLSMLPAPIESDSCRGIVSVKIEGDDEPLRLLRTVAIYGPNASGKSTVLFAAATLLYLIENSANFRSDQPIFVYLPFMLDKASPQSPCSLGVRGVVNGRVYEYAVKFDRAKFVEESLIRFSADTEETLFTRRGQSVEGPWKDDPQFGLLSASFRTNALLLSLADALTPSLASGIAVGLRHLLGYYDPTGPHLPFESSEPVADRAATDAEFGGWLRARIRDVDVGVVDYITEEAPPRRTPSISAGGATDDPSRRKPLRLSLMHASTGVPVQIPYSRESKGTRRFVNLTPYFYDLSQGDAVRAYFVDELDASLHPTLLDGLVRHFNCDLPEAHVRGQLIFATHETSLLDDVVKDAKEATLRRDQVYFTEKDTTGASRLFALAEFKERKNLNIRKRYLQGRYGALPSLGEFAE
jgi:hypothetical protein